MPARYQILFLSLAVMAAYLWLSLPILSQFSLQAFALCILLYFVLKKLNDANVWQLLPTTAVDEMTLTTFAFLILIGATGGTASLFFPLIFVYLFFLSLTTKLTTAIIITLAVILFNYALHSTGLTTPQQTLDLSHLISMPMVMTFFLFAKLQYQKAKENQEIIKLESETINHYQVFLGHQDQQLQELVKNNPGSHFRIFLEDFLHPKLEQLNILADLPQNYRSLKGQITIIQIEVEKWLQYFKQRQ